jgi:hypothetical protein
MCLLGLLNNRQGKCGSLTSSGRGSEIFGPVRLCVLAPNKVLPSRGHATSFGDALASKIRSAANSTVCIHGSRAAAATAVKFN